MDRGTSAKTFVITGGATLRMVQRDGMRIGDPHKAFFFVGGRRGLTAVGAQRADQSLRHHARQAGREQERLHAHILQTRDRPHRRVGMQRGKYQVPSERCLNGDFCGFGIADFTDHHHIRVLTQNRAQATGEGHADAGVNLRLTDPFNHVFDRVFNRENVTRVVVQLLQSSVQRGAFAGTGRPRHQKNAVRFV